jgi:hypothetical protein
LTIASRIYSQAPRNCNESYEKAIVLFEAATQRGAPPDRCHCWGAVVANGVKGCFERFSTGLTRGYSDRRFSPATFYGVDAHALQHPEIHGKQQMCSILLRRCWVIERNAHAQSGTVPDWWQ